MLIALLADIHANREAMTACLADAESANVDRYVFLGDLVGYGADPAWVVDRVATMVAAGAVVVRGNHDAAIGDPREGMVAEAQTAIDWTRSRLDQRAEGFPRQPAARRGGGRPAFCPCQRLRAADLDLPLQIRARLSRASWRRTSG